MPAAGEDEESRWPAPHPSETRQGDDVGELDIHIEVDLEEEQPDRTENLAMPEKTTQRQAALLKRRGNRASTQAGAFVAEEMRHKRSQKHGPMTRTQAVAIGLSKARQAGIRVPRKKPASR